MLRRRTVDAYDWLCDLPYFGCLVYPWLKGMLLVLVNTYSCSWTMVKSVAALTIGVLIGTMVVCNCANRHRHSWIRSFTKTNNNESSGDHHLTDGANWGNKRHCTAQCMSFTVQLTYRYKSCIVMLALWCTILCTSVLLSNHPSLKWYRQRCEQCCHGHREWTKRKMIFI